MVHARTRVYTRGVLEAEGFPVGEVSEWLARPDAVVWVDLCAPDSRQLHELADELDLHELAVEDVLEPHQRPKLDHYATHRFLTCHAVGVDVGGAALEVHEVNAFLSSRWLVTVRADEGFPMAQVLARWDRSPDLAAQVSGSWSTGCSTSWWTATSTRSGRSTLLRRAQRWAVLRARAGAVPAA